MCNDCRTQDVTAIADALKAIAEIDVRYPSRLPARASAIGSIRRASAGLEESNRRLRQENEQLKQQAAGTKRENAELREQLAAAKNTVNERVRQLAAMKDDRDYYQRQRKQAVNEVYFLRLMNEIIRLMPGIELGSYAKGGTTGGFGISRIPDISLVVDIDNQMLELTNTVTGRRASSQLYYSRLTAQAFTALEAMLPDVTLTPANTPRRLHAELFVDVGLEKTDDVANTPRRNSIPVNHHTGNPNYRTDTRPRSSRELPELTDANVYGNRGQRPTKDEWL